MTLPAIRPVRNIVAATIEAVQLASLGAFKGSGVGFYGTGPRNQPQALTAPAFTGVANLAALPMPDAADLPTAIALVNALKADRNNAVHDLVNSVKATGNKNASVVDELREALGEVSGVGLVDITP